MDLVPRPQPSLPKTIEEATRRYLNNYSRNFAGSAHELARLKSMARALIYRLRKVRPRFYEEGLPTFVNQACSTLLTYDTSNREEARKFHLCHKAFLQILETFAKRGVPAGEVNFHNERVLLEHYEGLVQRQVQHEAKIDQLEAAEFDYDEIGEEDPDGAYAKVVRELDFHKSEMKRISIELAYLEGLQVEEEPHFELVVPPRSILNRLSQDQLANLENQMFEFVKANKNKRTAMFVDKSTIDGMIEKLNIDPEQFKKEELRHISKDALDAYKEYFRAIDEKNRELYYKELCERKSLRPKEGIILKGPEDIPEDVKVKLEQNSVHCKREIEEILEEYSKRPCAEDTQGDPLEASDDDEMDERSRIIEMVRRKGIMFERVKEEPRDDCEEELLDSDEEVEVDELTALNVVGNNPSLIQFAQHKPRNLEEHDPLSNGVNGDDSEVKMETNGHTSIIGPCEGDANDQEDEDDIECLGTIEPSDKVERVELE